MTTHVMCKIRFVFETNSTHFAIPYACRGMGSFVPFQLAEEIESFRANGTFEFSGIDVRSHVQFHVILCAIDLLAQIAFEMFVEFLEMGEQIVVVTCDATDFASFQIYVGERSFVCCLVHQQLLVQTET